MQYSSSNVASFLQFSIPDGKLFYPEPFIASPSYLHSDITYLHLFQYWYWVWFMFIFLICFFFISFLSTVRWCTTRIRPRRETRGVSRSKCGDLITACVPVSWAISIIVNESADATDLNDGFGTAELVVGVRAYQWGWEYYYPKTIDLNYNVNPSYSTFVGNSLKYNFSSAKTLSSNTLWRMYQNKPEDSVITPAHLMLLPVDSSNTLNFLNFKNIGMNTLQESSAFQKIRNATKVYNSHLVTTPSSTASTYKTINSLYFNENTFLNSSLFGVKRQTNLLSATALGNSFGSTLLDVSSFDTFLHNNFNASGVSNRVDSALQPSSLSLDKSSVHQATPDSARLTHFLSSPNLTNSNAFTALQAYPNLLSFLNDNSDKAGLSYPLTKISSPSITQGQLLAPTAARAGTDLTDVTNSVISRGAFLTNNFATTPRVFNTVGPNSKILLGDQSIRNFPSLSPSKSNLNLSNSVNTVTSNTLNRTYQGQAATPFENWLNYKTDYSDKVLANQLSSSRSFIGDSYPAVLSSDPKNSNSLEYDSAASNVRSLSYSPKSELMFNTAIKSSSVGDVFVGSREKTPRAINTAYWSSFWATSNPTLRVNSAVRANLERTNFVLPAFTAYSDYDFRNDQAYEMLEEVFWETNYSGYNFYDYLTCSREALKGRAISAKDFGLEKQFYNSTLGIDLTSKSSTTSALKEQSQTGNFYSNPIQMEDAIVEPTKLQTQSFSFLSFYPDLTELDESYANLKSLHTFFDKFTSSLVGISSQTLSPRSYVSVFNHFRSDFEDFTWSRTLPLRVENIIEAATLQSSTNNASADLTLNTSDLTLDGSTLGSDLRLSNPATLRPSIRNAIVNANAFQKVFKPRLDEGRAHVQSSSFADLALKQPYLSHNQIPYLQLLGKNRSSFFQTPLFFNQTQKNFNPMSALVDATNTPMFDFPFLLARTSDTMRFTWIDWFSKWRYVEVQPSSVSRYSTLGVPYFRKPFDFNSSTGDKFQDTELYFTRVAKSRRNYLSTWSYSPYMYRRAYLWDAVAGTDALFLNKETSLDAVQVACDSMSWYWLNPSFNLLNADTVNYSISGDSIYNKSTWTPRSSIAAYYYNVAKLVDILSRRELLYRQYLELSSPNKVTYLPKTLTATPSNPLLQEMKSSFRFSDPANFSSEYSRDLLYSSAHFFKFSYFQSLIRQTAESLNSAPFNVSLFSNYVFFYFFGTDSNNVTSNSELYKSQFRPLRKGITSMLRLHATGAVAMPIEIRLQILASSRDVIHSWAIPSASIKIDCVPGYTSHRMMKFLLTGVYWGQCQEICGRYHHWMPIVVYFMKRDLFFLWCTHFVMAPTPNSTWDISDRRFADLLKFVSYDKSSWLSEFGTTN